MPGKEVSTQDIALDALRNSKSVFVPYIHAGDDKTKVIDMLRLRDEEDLNSLTPDAWGIPSLKADSVGQRANALGGTGTSPSGSPELDLMFVPGVAFDRFHSRLGHGMGFYDRYLEAYAKAVNGSDKKMPVLGKCTGVLFPTLADRYSKLVCPYFNSSCRNGIRFP